eukprot:165249-Chlamydomonas_euryale.AAC.1
MLRPSTFLVTTCAHVPAAYAGNGAGGWVRGCPVLPAAAVSCKLGFPSTALNPAPTLIKPCTKPAPNPAIQNNSGSCNGSSGPVSCATGLCLARPQDVLHDGGLRVAHVRTLGPAARACPTLISPVSPRVALNGER